MSNLSALAIDHGDLLQSTAYALETLANLLGADGCEHHFTRSDTNDLTHAVRALSGYVSAAGMALYEAAELAGELEAKQ